MVGTKSAFGPGYGVGGDQVEPFALELVEGVSFDVFGLGGEAHEELVGATFFREGGHDVGDRLKLDGQALAVLLEFLRLGGLRAPVADGGRHDQDVTGTEERVSLAVHLGGGDDRIDHHAGRFGQRDRARDEIDRPAGFLGGGRQGEAHLARRRIADEANRVEELARGTGGDEAAEGQGGLKMADEGWQRVDKGRWLPERSPWPRMGAETIEKG